MTRSGWALAVLVVVILVVIWRTNERHGDVLRRADSLATVATHQRGQAEAWHVLFEQQQARVDTAVVVRRVRDRVVDTLVQVVRELPVPEGCESVVAEHRLALDSLAASRDDWRDQFTAQREATATLQQASVADSVAYASLSAAYRLARNPPKKLTLSPAVFAGLCTDGRPCAGLGVTLRWGR